MQHQLDLKTINLILEKIHVKYSQNIQAKKKMSE